MKIILGIVTISIFILTSCKSDNFYETKRIIQTDKDEYNVGDTIQLTLKIIPEQQEKKIRVYENYRNLEISFALINEKTDIYNENWSESSGEKLPQTKTKELIITKEKPFEKKFLIYTSYNNDKINLNIPELKLNVEYVKERIKNDSIRIHGFCNPINPEFGASLKEYFEVKDIKLDIKEPVVHLAQINFYFV